VAFDPISEVREGPVYTVNGNVDVKETYTKRAKNAGEVAVMKTGKINAVHFQADIRLEALVTLRQQVQALTRLVQLLYLHTDRSAWPLGERALATLMLARLTNIQDIRAVEDIKVSEVEALSTAMEIADYDAGAGWP
jgi:hypothetical protein